MRIMKEAMKPLAQLCSERQHLKHPIPRPLEIRTTKVISLTDWRKFYSGLPSKLQESCEHHIDGKTEFFGEYGMDAALALQNMNRFKGKFHFIMCCNNEEIAHQALQAANKVGLDVSELEYHNKLKKKVKLSGKSLLDRVVKSK